MYAEKFKGKKVTQNNNIKRNFHLSRTIPMGKFISKFVQSKNCIDTKILRKGRFNKKNISLNNNKINKLIIIILSRSNRFRL